MKTFLSLLLNFLITAAGAQIQISGNVETASGMPVAGANVYIRDSYDGGTTDSDGRFSFETDLTGQQMLIVSFVGYEPRMLRIEIEGSVGPLAIELDERAEEIEAVMIMAGTFEAGDRHKSVILSPMDVALTAGAGGDIFSAFGTLPGSHRIGEEGRLFVRGGEGHETSTFMDGMLINTPYFSRMPDLPTRGRFSPMLFHGAVFSTGGYSAEFGQALSSIVALNTTPLEQENRSSISVMTVGAHGSHARRWKNTSLALTGELLHMGLSNKLFNPNIDWINDPVIAGSTLMFRKKTSETGMIKTFGSFNHNSSRMWHHNFRESAYQDISLLNNNSYINTTYNEELNQNWILHAGIALNLDSENIGLDDNSILSKRTGTQARVTFTNLSVENITTKAGVGYQYYDYSQNIRMDGDFLLSFSNHQLSAFIESEAKITNAFALRAGMRAEHNSVTEATNLNPRLSAAIKTGRSSQVSAAYGTFIQNPQDAYLKFAADLGPEMAEHWILSWQYKKAPYTLRLEAYYKDYKNLVRFRNEFSPEPGNFSNTGSGYARGIDVFWRNQKPFGRSDYWISYSWIDARRIYRDFPVRATPHFVPAHNLSAVYKKFFTGINSFVSGTWSLASGRPYYNPNNPAFMADHTKPFTDVSLGFTHIFYLFNRQAVSHLVLNNIFGFNNIYGYTYSKTPDDDGFFGSSPIISPQKRMAVLLISLQL
jgi:hypothetical protein